MIYERIVSGFMLALATAGMIYVQGFAKPNARYAPMIGFAIIIVFSVWTLAGSILKARRTAKMAASESGAAEAAPSAEPLAVSAKEEGAEAPAASASQKTDRIKNIIKIAITILYFISFKYVYFFISTPIVITAVGLLSGISWKKTIPTAVVTSAVVYGVFIMWLNVYIA